MAYLNLTLARALAADPRSVTGLTPNQAGRVSGRLLAEDRVKRVLCLPQHKIVFLLAAQRLGFSLYGRPI